MMFTTQFIMKIAKCVVVCTPLQKGLIGSMSLQIWQIKNNTTTIRVISWMPLKIFKIETISLRRSFRPPRYSFCPPRPLSRRIASPPGEEHEERDGAPRAWPQQRTHGEACLHLLPVVSSYILLHSRTEQVEGESAPMSPFSNVSVDAFIFSLFHHLLTTPVPSPLTSPIFMLWMIANATTPPQLRSAHRTPPP